MLFIQPYHQHISNNDEIELIIPEGTLIGLNRGKFTVNQKVETHLDYPLEIYDFIYYKRRSNREYMNIICGPR